MAEAQKTAPTEIAEGVSSWAVAWRQFRKDRLALFGVVLVLALSGVAVFAPLLANGRPLYVRGYLTNFYDADAAAFGDWHRRYQDTVLQLRAGVARRDQLTYEARHRLYTDGLPRVLQRLADNLPGPLRKELLELRTVYSAYLTQPREAVDLVALDELGQQIERRFCNLSLSSAYKHAAMPLLTLPKLVDGVRDAREIIAAGDSTAEERAEAQSILAHTQAEASRLQQALEEATLSIQTFLDAQPRTRLATVAAEARVSLGELAKPDGDLARTRAKGEALAVLLDELAESSVRPALQKLPLVARWPAIHYLSPLEVFFIVLYLCVLLGLAFWRTVPGFSPKSILLYGPLLGVAAMVLWFSLVPEAKPPAESQYKAFARDLEAHPDGVSAVVFPLVPYGENENIHADRVTAPAVWERFGPEAQQVSLARRLSEHGQPSLDPKAAGEALTRLRSHWLGTDDNGRDVLSRLIYGSRISLSVGFVAVGIYVLIGVILGALAGYFGGWVDALLMRFTEIVMCFPSFFLIVTIMAVVQKPSIFYIMVIIGITRWTEVMRLVRGEFLRLGSMDFVAAAKALGLHPLRIVFRHILPNAFGPVFVAAAFGVAGAILVESALSFLGFGVPQPTASWGSVLNVAFGQEKQMWWITIFAGFFIFITVTAYNLVGEGLRDALDPKLRQ